MVSKWTRYVLAVAIPALCIANHLGKPRVYETEKGRVVKIGLSALFGLDEDRDGTLDRYFIGIGTGRGGGIVELNSVGEVVSPEHMSGVSFQSQMSGLDNAYDSLNVDDKN